METKQIEPKEWANLESFQNLLLKVLCFKKQILDLGMLELRLANICITNISNI